MRISERLMLGVRIKDTKSEHVLIDLRDILRVLNDELSKVNEWKVRFVEFTATSDVATSYSANFTAPVGGRIGQFKIEHRRWSIHELKDFAGALHQTFDGEIVGYKKTPKGKRISIFIKAFDTSWWDVFSTDDKVIAIIEAGFKKTQMIESVD